MRFVALSNENSSSQKSVTTNSNSHCHPQPSVNDSLVIEGMITCLQNQLVLNNKLFEKFLIADEARQSRYEKQLAAQDFELQELRDRLDKLENACFLMESSYEQESFTHKGRVYELENQIIGLKARERGREQQKDYTVSQLKQQQKAFEDQLEAQRKGFEARIREQQEGFEARIRVQHEELMGRLKMGQKEVMARMEKLESAAAIVKEPKPKKSVNFSEMAIVRTFNPPQYASPNLGKQISDDMECFGASGTSARSSALVRGASFATARSVVPAKAKMKT
ncbi:hypothetical protein CNBK0710 [Cryptococcus deneoformans B-3501A]|uniref:hypothetical protein n=1 Tax=Cryptococcus deneoformans (strain B-3501A) TaxID=283643 RepID=UPI000042D604|nr:hypothetical protein CNBK0710 [Cryptococcus neoformans var. neoformans B-3501A]EAL18050.1 hypothetical protein CNBK0710 [Cryptococcus neoformans var. neoformans B-3501A]